ncbi:hypothetical protein [Flavobacterium sp. JP2137]|uniref:hypothetical protein n=1 Tax=Flavobacterium sp. JP2137 TaxID=3414510 RepID=UPI003D2FCCA8
MVKVRTIIVFFLLSLGVYAQDGGIFDMFSKELRISQKEGTNAYLKEYLREVDTQEDEIYVVIYRPMSCPRCEFGIRLFFNELKAQIPKAATVLVSYYDDPISPKIYAEKNRFFPDFHVVDTEQLYKKVFSFSSNDLQGLYLLKIDKKKGRLLVGGEMLNMGAKFVKALVDSKEVMPYHTYETEEEIDEDPIPHVLSSSLKFEKFEIETDERHPISGVYSKTVIKDELLLFTDELANAAYVFKVDFDSKKIAFVQEIVADSLERIAFVNVPEEEFTVREEKGMISYIACEVDFVGEREIGVSYSLPRLFMESPTNLAYYNEPVLLVREKEGLKKKPLVSFDFDIFNEDYMYQHYSFSPIGNDRVVLMCLRLTWPLGMDLEDYQGKDNLDPFMDKFYEQENPFLAVFDTKTGKLVERFGNLEREQRLSRTGYYFTSPVVGSHEESVIYGNGYNGRLYFVHSNNLSKVLREYVVFEVDSTDFPPLDSDGFYQTEYARKYDRFFNKYIERIKLTEEHIFVLIKKASGKGWTKEAAYDFVQIDRESGKTIRRFTLGKEFADERILSVGLGDYQGEIRPYYLGKKQGENYIKYLYE